MKPQFKVEVVDDESGEWFVVYDEADDEFYARFYSRPEAEDFAHEMNISEERL